MPPPPTAFPSRGQPLPDAIVLAGDLSHRLGLVEEALRARVSLSCPKLFVPGNHDVRVLGQAPEARSSREKYDHHLPRLAAAAGFASLPREPVLPAEGACVRVPPVASFTLQGKGCPVFPSRSTP